MELLKPNLELVAKLIIEQDLDFLLVITGRERVGKSSLALQIASIVDPAFDIKQVVFDIQSLYEQVYSLKKGQVVIIDEGATALFSRDAMSLDVKDGVKLLTVMGERNLFVILCIPSWFLMDKYVRESRASGLIRVIARGSFKYYSKRRIKQAFYNPKANAHNWGQCSFKDDFDKFEGPLWEAYKVKKSEYLKGRSESRLNDGVQKNELVKVGTLAKEFLMSRSTVVKWIQDGKLKGECNASGHWVGSRKQLLEIVKSENVKKGLATRIKK